MTALNTTLLPPSIHLFPKLSLSEACRSVDLSTIHCWVVHFSPQLLEGFNRSLRTVTSKWQTDEATSRSAVVVCTQAFTLASPSPSKKAARSMRIRNG